MSEDKVFIGFTKEKTFRDGGSITQISFRAEDLDTMRNYLNNAGYVNIDIKKSKGSGKLYSEINTWGVQPTMPQEEKAEFAAPAPPDDSDVPF